MSASALRSDGSRSDSRALAPHWLLASPRTLHPLCLRHSSHCSAQLGLGQMLHSSSPWDPALFLSFCFLLFMVLNPALGPCANALLLAKLNSFQGRLHKSSGLVLGARPAGLDVLFSRPRSCWRTCWHELPPKRSQQDASGLPGWEEPEQQSCEVRDRLCKSSLKRKSIIKREQVCLGCFALC